jgi:3-oxoacyl-[acyl-carrier protein] reductase
MALENTTVLVTGGGRGIGRSAALIFAREGCNLALCSRTKRELEKTKKEIESMGRKCFIRPCDARNPSQVKRFVKDVLGKFRRIDILVNNAGIGLNIPFEKMSEDQIRATLDTNLLGIMLFTKAAIPAMKKQRSGTIINISSGAGHRGYPGLSVYCSTKFGVLGFTQSVAPELAVYGIRVLAVCPGATDTEMYRKSFGRRARTKPRQVAEIILKAASGHFKTGSCIDAWEYL